MVGKWRHNFGTVGLFDNPRVKNREKPIKTLYDDCTFFSVEPSDTATRVVTDKLPIHRQTHTHRQIIYTNTTIFAQEILEIFIFFLNSHDAIILQCHTVHVLIRTK